jgi:hypothetical protein
MRTYGNIDMFEGIESEDVALEEVCASQEEFVQKIHGLLVDQGKVV